MPPSLTPSDSKDTVIAGLVNQVIIGLSLRECRPGNNICVLASKAGHTGVFGWHSGAAAAVGKVGAFTGTWAFTPIIEAFGGDTTARGNTGPFRIGSGLPSLSAIIMFFCAKPLTVDGMVKEDEEFRAYLEVNGYDTSQMGLPSGFIESATPRRGERWW